MGKCWLNISRDYIGKLHALVRGYSTTKTLSVPAGVSLEQDIVRELLSQKQSLELELKHYENNNKYNEELETPDVTINGVIPASTRLQIVIETKDSKVNPHVEVFISTNNDTIIKAIIVFSEGIFNGETHVIHPPTSKLKTCVSVPLHPKKDTPLDIHLKVLVGYPNSAQYHVFELTRQLPKFSMYSLQKDDGEYDVSHSVSFEINERLQRICMWINQNFLLPEDLEYESGSELKLRFRCLRDDTTLGMKFHIAGNVTFFAVNMGLVADLVQSLAGFLNLQDLESRASFPKYETALIENMQKLESIQDARVQLNSDNADKMQKIRNSLLLAENCRINNELEEMSEHYTELNFLNKELMKGYNVKLSNYVSGVETMKEINSIIQKASRLRVGSHAAQVISCCRNAIMANNVEGLVTILRTGSL